MITTDVQWKTVKGEREQAYFRADVCLGSPQSFSLDEWREICERMETSSKVTDAAMRADPWSLTGKARNKLLDILGKSGCEMRLWREELLEVE